MATRKNNQERSKSGSLRVDHLSLTRTGNRPIWACAAVVLRVTCSPRGFRVWNCEDRAYIWTCSPSKLGAAPHCT